MTDEIIYVTDVKVWCEGESPAIGHPRVYLDLTPKGEIDCPYCGRKFVLKESAAVAH